MGSFGVYLPEAEAETTLPSQILQKIDVREESHKVNLETLHDSTNLHTAMPETKGNANIDMNVNMLEIGMGREAKGHDYADHSIGVPVVGFGTTEGDLSAGMPQLNIAMENKSKGNAFGHTNLHTPEVSTGSETRRAVRTDACRSLGMPKLVTVGTHGRKPDDDVDGENVKFLNDRYATPYCPGDGVIEPEGGYEIDHTELPVTSTDAVHGRTGVIQTGRRIEMMTKTVIDTSLKKDTDEHVVIGQNLHVKPLSSVPNAPVSYADQSLSTKTDSHSESVRDETTGNEGLSNDDNDEVSLESGQFYFDVGDNMDLNPDAMFKSAGFHPTSFHTTTSSSSTHIPAPNSKTVNGDDLENDDGDDTEEELAELEDPNSRVSGSITKKFTLSAPLKSERSVNLLPLDATGTTTTSTSFKTVDSSTSGVYVSDLSRYALTPVDLPSDSNDDLTEVGKHDDNEMVGDVDEEIVESPPPTMTSQLTVQLAKVMASDSPSVHHYEKQSSRELLLIRSSGVVHATTTTSTDKRDDVNNNIRPSVDSSDA
jgi:hypothetical protein